jgi:hypothetical protein
MNEFLKNFRNAQSSRYAGKKNPYDGHYYANQNTSEIRNGNERRSARNSAGSPGGVSQNSIFQKVEELIPLLRNVLETMIDNQDELFELKKRQEENMSTMATAFHEIARTFCNTDIPKKPAAPVKKKTTPEINETEFSLEDIEKEGMQSAASKKREVIKLMKKLRKKGGTYKEIATFLNEKKIATFSNNGKWHAQTIHRLCGK